MNWYITAIIKLKKQESASPYNALNEIKSLGKQNPLNPRETIINDVKIEVSVYDDHAIWLKSIESMYKRQGNGTIALRKIIDIANKNNVIIYLDPMPFGDMKSRDLVRWYMDNGFVRGKEDFVAGLIHLPPKN